MNLYETARANGALISVEEVLLLLPETASRGELAEAILTAPSLSSKLELRGDYVTSRDATAESAVHLSKEVLNRRRATLNMAYASAFVPLASRAGLPLIAVSGSTSYNSVSRSTDLDFFCVTRNGSLWTAMTKLLLFARAFRLANRGSPEICFSCVMAKDYASSTFTREQGALFARDALQTMVMDGGGIYSDLLRRARWIRGLYPALYEKRLAAALEGNGSAASNHGLALAINGFLYRVVGTYIRLKSFIRNRSLIKAGKPSETFYTLLGEDHLIYESKRYRQMAESFRESNTNSASVQNR